MRRATLVVTDVDNTLFDWYSYWGRAFSSFLSNLAALSGVAGETIACETRRLFRKYGTVEFVFVVQELACLRAAASGKNLLVHYRPAIAAFRKEAAKGLVPFPGVRETLGRLRDADVRVVALTDSPAYQAVERCRALGLDGLLQAVYSQPDVVPPEVTVARSRPSGSYRLEATAHRVLEPELRKPNPDALMTVLRDFSVPPASAVYVGDSLIRDIAMARAAGVFDVLALYGAGAARPACRLVASLLEEEPTPAEEVMGSISPSFTLYESFAEVMAVPLLRPA